MAKKTDGRHSGARTSSTAKAGKRSKKGKAQKKGASKAGQNFSFGTSRSSQARSNADLTNWNTAAKQEEAGRKAAKTIRQERDKRVVKLAQQNTAVVEVKVTPTLNRDQLIAQGLIVRNDS